MICFSCNKEIDSSFVKVYTTFTNGTVPFHSDCFANFASHDYFPIGRSPTRCKDCNGYLDQYSKMIIISFDSFCFDRYHFDCLSPQLPESFKEKLAALR